MAPKDTLEAAFPQDQCEDYPDYDQHPFLKRPMTHASAPEALARLSVIGVQRSLGNLDETVGEVAFSTTPR